ncbi:MAG: hypothetical protein HZB59_04600 [Ignavibacteriales bacterium]|nr:hypothetical protein [Ignavibacteriales bacterium]
MMKPAVPRRWLFLIAGSLWSIAGLILIERAYEWLNDYETEQLLLILLLGAALALLFFFTMFIRVARKNINRLFSLPDSVCIFAFTAWKGYFLIAFMVSAGIIVRNSSFPKHYLAVIYVAMGGALLLGSFMFHKNYFIKN